MFAGRDASRGLATMTTECPSDQYDSLSDLTEAQLESLARWEKQFAGNLGLNLYIFTFQFVGDNIQWFTITNFA